MRIALYGPYLYQLAVALRENTENEVRLFLDEETFPRSLLDESAISDRSLVHFGKWATRSAIIRPHRAPVTRLMSAYDVILATELGPIFARHARTRYFFIPSGWDLTSGPFPIRTRSLRPRGIGDISAAIVAMNLRRGIRAAEGIWGAPFPPLVRAASLLGRCLSADLPQPIDTDLFAPEAIPIERKDSNTLEIFHPTRMIMSQNPTLMEIGRWKGNDILFRGMAYALDQGVDLNVSLIDRGSSPDQELATSLIADLGLEDHVTWLHSGSEKGFTWRDLAGLYRASDIVIDQFGGWFGLVSLEGASCGKPVINRLNSEVMTTMHPGGHPFLQARTPKEVADKIVLCSDPAACTAIGNASRKWVVENHDRSTVGKICETILSNEGLK